MARARDLFLEHVSNPNHDPGALELRDSLTRAKRKALEESDSSDDARLAQLMSELYQHVVVTEVRLCSHVGLGVGLALSAMDEHRSGASLSGFGREARQHMSERSEVLKNRPGSVLFRLLAQIEAHRLAWRHSHEFLSWLAFRRDDPRYPAADRLARFEAYRLAPQLLQTREFLMGVLGVRLSAALEGSDRFFLANRWRLAPSTDHALEHRIWPLLSYQPRAAVRVEQARFEYDARVDAGTDGSPLEGLRQEIMQLFQEQLAEALEGLPTTAEFGAF